MKSKYVVLASALLSSVIAFAQKDKIKDAEKALNAGNPQEAIKVLDGALMLISDSDVNGQAYYYTVNGKAYLELSNKKVDEEKNLLEAVKSFQEVISIEKAAGKSKYSEQVAANLVVIKRNLINSAVDDAKVNRNLEGASKLYNAYLLDKKDTINLYHAASNYVKAKDYVAALKCYSELKTLNFSGKGVMFVAFNIATKEDDVFASIAERDLAVSTGTHENPTIEKVSSKRGEIYKNVALILVNQGKTDQAKKAIVDARKSNPEDITLLYAEANLYLQTKDLDLYKKLVSEALQKSPNNLDLLFNLGILSVNANNFVDAEKYYKRVLEINPKYTNAYINLAALKLENEKLIIDQMNKLGTSVAEMKQYDVLKVQREELFKSSIPYLKVAANLEPNNVDVTKTLMNVYSALEMTTEYKELKDKVKAYVTK